MSSSPGQARRFRTSSLASWSAEQLLHVGLRPFQRLRHQDPLDRLVPDPERDRIPVHPEHLVAVLAQAAPAEVRARVLGRLRDGVLDLLLADEPFHLSLVAPEDSTDPSRGGCRGTGDRASATWEELQVDALAVHEVLDHHLLGHPVDRRPPARAGSRSSASSTCPSARGPRRVHAARPGRRSAAPAPGTRAGAARREHALPFDARPSGGRLGSWETSLIARTGSRSEKSRSIAPSSIIESTIAVAPVAQVDRVLAHVRVADDHVQAAVLLAVGVGLVARVDDRPLDHGVERDLGLEEVGALGELVVAGVRAVLACRPCRRPRRPGASRRTASGARRSA